MLVVPAALLDCFQSDRVLAATIGEFVNAARPQRHLAVVVFRVWRSCSPAACGVRGASALMHGGWAAVLLSRGHRSSAA